MAYVNKSDIYKLFDESNGVIRLHIADVDILPTADVVEVKHGEWIWTENGQEDYEQYWVCTVCKEKSYFKTNFCSDCGAKMDGGNTE